MSLASVRQQIADLINDADLGFTVRPRPSKTAKKGDGWVIVERVRPSVDSFVSAEADFSVVLLAGSQDDPAAAENVLDAAAVAVIEALAEIPASGLTVEPATVPVASSAFLALVVTLTMEV